MTRRLGSGWLPLLHVEAPTPKHVENSIGGANLAVERGYPGIDWDWQLTKPDPRCRHCHAAGVVCVGHRICTHWLRPCLRDGFHDPAHQLGRFARVDRHTLDEVSRLITRDGHRIHEDTRMFAVAAARDLKVAAEVKHPGYSDVEVMRRFSDAATDAGCNMRVMKLSDGAAPLATLRAAKAVGRETIMIARGPIPDSWRPFIDYRRGPARYWR